ncbi:hypothetical protein PSPO01_14099 [Paraphaeosphaeria sporulosa]
MGSDLPSPGLLAASRVRKLLGHMGCSANEMGNGFCTPGSSQGLLSPVITPQQSPRHRLGSLAPRNASTLSTGHKAA